MRHSRAAWAGAAVQVYSTPGPLTLPHPCAVQLAMVVFNRSWRAGRFRLSLSCKVLSLVAGASGCEPEARLSAELGLDARAQEMAVDATAPEPPVDVFAERVIADVEATWARAFSERGKAYTPVEPLLFAQGALVAHAGSQPVDVASAGARAAFDLTFQRRLQHSFGMASRAAQAYTLAHQMGHHVQRVLGLDSKVRTIMQSRPALTLALTLPLELQADCFAGVWSRLTRQHELLAPRDLERALREASVLGAELRTAAREGREPAAAETFTYASPHRRGYWFGRGNGQGRMEDCDTFRDP